MRRWHGRNRRARRARAHRSCDSARSGINCVRRSSIPDYQYPSMSSGWPGEGPAGTGRLRSRHPVARVTAARVKRRRSAIDAFLRSGGMPASAAGGEQIAVLSRAHCGSARRRQRRGAKRHRRLWRVGRRGCRNGANGWIIAYTSRASAPKRTERSRPRLWCSTPAGSGGGIWMASPGRRHTTRAIPAATSTSARPVTPGRTSDDELRALTTSARGDRPAARFDREKPPRRNVVELVHAVHGCAPDDTDHRDQDLGAAARPA